MKLYNYVMLSLLLLMGTARSESWMPASSTLQATVTTAMNYVPVRFLQVCAGIGLGLAGLNSIGWPSSVVYNHVYLPVKGQLIALARNHPWISHTARFCLPIAALVASYTLLFKKGDVKAA